MNLCRRLFTSPTYRTFLSTTPIYLVKNPQFHTSSPRRAINPLLWAIVKPIAKVGAAIFGRSFRIWYSKLPAARQRQLYEGFMGNRRNLIGIGLLGGTATIYYVATHLERTPITNRLRFVAVTSRQVMNISEMEEKLILVGYEDKFLPTSDRRVRRVANVVDRLLKGSGAMPGVADKQWQVSVILSPEINAFVIPNGHIFVFTGMLDVVENDDQLSVVLGHEMSHTILGHASEQLSRTQFVDWIVIVSMAFLWAFIWGDGIALVSNWFLNKCAHLALHLPYSRKLETEADTVGLQITARACYDVRESYTYWKNMELMEKTGEKFSQVPPYLSTHPSHGVRAHHLDQITPECLEMRTIAKCPPLPYRDPRDGVDQKIRLVEEKLALANQL